MFTNTAGQEAGCLPEIVSEIVDKVEEDFDQSKDRTLVACTLVNSLWEDEANRRLWRFVGEHLELVDQPKVRHLVAINANRRQKFANYILELAIGVEDLAGPWEGRFHPKLAELSFPRLEVLTLHGPSASHSTNLQPPLLQYLQPRLSQLWIFDHDKPLRQTFSDKFFFELRTRYKGLELFFLEAVNEKFVAPKALAFFLRDTPSLVDLTLSPGPITAAYYETFRYIALHPALRTVSITTIYDSWAKTRARIEHFVPKTTIPLLRHIIHGITTATAFLMGIQELGLKARNGPGSEDMFGIIARAGLSRLVKLKLEPIVASTIYAADLLCLAESCPGLETPEIPWRNRVATPILCSELDDEAFEDVAKLLPKLKHLHLLQHGIPFLTHRSLISLSAHCPDLQLCRLTAVICFKTLIERCKDPTQVIHYWPNLQTLQILSPVGVEEHQHETEVDDASERAKTLLELFPSLSRPELTTDWFLNIALERALSRANGQRYRNGRNLEEMLDRMETEGPGSEIRVRSPFSPDD